MHLMKYPSSLVVAASLLVAACSSETKVSPSPSADASATLPGLAQGDPAAFDTYCELGGSPGHVGATANAKCTLGWCAYDGRRELPRPDGTGTYSESYCTADCAKVGCVDGWECVATSDGPKVCLKEVAVCGDGRKQPDEACDDGNTSEKDGCSADCAKVRAGGYLVVEKLTVDGKSTAFTMGALPSKTGTTYGELDAISPASFRVRFAFEDEKVQTLTYELALPRKVGVVDAGPTSPFYVAVYGGGTERLAETAPSELEVVEAGTDQRSYRVTFRATTSHPASGTFVVTLP